MIENVLYFVALGCFGCLATLLSLIGLAKLAPKFGLLDIPTGRKQHDRPVPMVGGLAIFIALLAQTCVWWIFYPDASISTYSLPTLVFTLCCSFIVVTGVLDDRYNLGVAPRVASELTVAALFSGLLQLKIASLGNLLGTGEIFLPNWLAYPFTVLAFFGVINAFNMLDGLDGQVAALTLCSLTGMTLISGVGPSELTVVIFGATLAFLISNLAMIKGLPKTFLGDTGSKLLGFLVVLSLVSVSTSRHSAQTINAVSALFVIAIPLYDMVFISLRRMARGNSPFSADRGHLHHLLQGFGLSPQRALLAALTLHGFLNLLGYGLNEAGVTEAAQFGMFLGALPCTAWCASATGGIT